MLSPDEEEKFSMITIREYISQKLSALGQVTEADLLDMSISGGFYLDEVYSECYAQKVGISIAGAIEEHILAPHVSSVSESGFSISWNLDNLGKYYLWLCNKWGITPNKKALELIGINTITDRTEHW